MKSYTLTLFVVLFVIAGQAAASEKKENEPKKDQGSSAETAKVAVEKEKSEDKVMATVNGKPIIQSTIDEKIAPQLEMARQYGQEPTEQVLDSFRKRVLQGVIREQLIADKIEQKKISVSEDEINAKLQEFAQQQGATIETLIESAKGRGYTEEKIKEQVKMGIGFDKLMEAEAGKDALAVSEEDAKKFYDENIDMYSSPEEVKASHILAGGRGFDSFDEEKKAEAKSRIEEVQKKLKEGMPFEEAAKQYSDCPSKEKGGDLEVYISKEGLIGGRPGMDPTFSAAAHTLKVGEYGDIVKTPFGYHIIKCTDRKEAEVKTFDEVKESIIEQLKSQKQASFAKDYIDKLVSDADIVYPESEKLELDMSKVEIKPAGESDKK